MAVDAQYVRDLIRSLDVLYFEIEAKRSVVIPTGVRNLIEGIILESVLLRASSWQTKQHLNVDDPDDLKKTIDVLNNTVRALLYDAPTDGDLLTIIGTVEQIHKKWCGVFPFCR